MCLCPLKQHCNKLRDVSVSSRKKKRVNIKINSTSYIRTLPVPLVAVPRLRYLDADLLRWNFRVNPGRLPRKLVMDELTLELDLGYSELPWSSSCCHRGITVPCPSVTFLRLATTLTRKHMVLPRSLGCRIKFALSSFCLNFLGITEVFF